MRRSLVTGGAGFIGSHVARELVAAGHAVTVADDLSGGFAENVPAGAEFVQGDVSDPALVATLFDGHAFDYVYHLAAYAAEGLSHYIRRYNYTNNLLASVNLINAAINHNVQCFVFASSIAVYGSSAELPIREDQATNPEDPYGIAKLAVERDLWSAARHFGLRHVIFRPHNVYGEQQNIGDMYRNVVGIFMNQILQSKPMTIFGDGEQTRAFTYIDDVAPVIARAAERPSAWNQTFNVGSDQHVSVNALARAVAVAMGVSADLQHMPARQEVVHAYCSHEKLRAAFDVTGEVPLTEGLARMAEWVTRHGAREGKLFEGLDVRKNFPKAWERLLVQ